MVNVITSLSVALAHAGHHGDSETSVAGGLLHAVSQGDHLLVLAVAAAALVVAPRAYRLARARRRNVVAAVIVDRTRNRRNYRPVP